MKSEQLYLVLKKAIDASPVIPACQTTDPEVWFADAEEGFNYTREAKLFCAHCPVRKPCAEYAIEAEEMHGIWGGLTPRERQRIRSNGVVRGRGRPAKEKTLTT